MSEIDDIMEGVAEAKPWTGANRNWIKAGEHELELKELVFKKTGQGKKAFFATFVAIKSPVHKPGELVISKWNMSHHKEPWQEERDKGKLSAFVQNLLGSAFLGEKPDAAKVKKALGDLIGTGQPGRGIRVRAIGFQAGEKFVDVDFETVKGQTGESVKANRARQDRGDLPSDGAVTKSETAAKTETDEGGLGGILGL